MRFLAGGTNLVDLMKENVERPAHVIDINRLPLARIEELDGGGLRLGALATNNETADDPLVARAIRCCLRPSCRAPAPAA